MKFGIIYVGEIQLPNVQYGSQVWKNYAVRHPHFAQDLYGQMLYGVLIANARLAERTASGIEHKNPSSYVRVVVKGFIRGFLEKQNMFGYKSEITLRKKGRAAREREWVNVAKVAADRKAGNLTEITEIIESCYDNERERKIVALVVAGYNHIEIADQMCRDGYTLTRQRTQQIIANFARKVQCKLTNGESDSMKSQTKNLQRELS